MAGTTTAGREGAGSSGGRMIKEPLDYGIRAVQRSDKQPDVDSDELYASAARKRRSFSSIC